MQLVLSSAVIHVTFLLAAILIVSFTVVCNVLWCKCAYLKNKIIIQKKKKKKKKPIYAFVIDQSEK